MKAGAVLMGALALAIWVRYGLIESSGTSAFCFAAANDATSVPFQCLIRGWFVAAVGTPMPGVIALVMGMAAVVTRRWSATLMAIGCGAAGMVLYAGMPAAAGFLCGWITLARRWQAARPAVSGA
ncbi:MAG: hypothetical protein ACREUW_18320 [Burkholderiales bacterium]